MLTHDDAETMIATMLSSGDGAGIGEVVAVYTDTDTKRPEWALVQLAEHRAEQRFVPLLRAQWIAGAPHVPYTPTQVHHAPDIHTDGELSPDHEAQLYTHYGLDYAARSTLGSPTSGSATLNHHRHLA